MSKIPSDLHLLTVSPQNTPVLLTFWCCPAVPVNCPTSESPGQRPFSEGGTVRGVPGARKPWSEHVSHCPLYRWYPVGHRDTEHPLCGSTNADCEREGSK